MDIQVDGLDGLFSIKHMFGEYASLLRDFKTW